MKKNELKNGELIGKAEERIKVLEPLLSEIARRAEKMGIDDNGIDFTVTIDKELWDQIKDSI